jgi:ferrous-iron efflux pump FieF
MLVSMLLTYGLVWFQRYVVERTGSHAIAADEAHYTADFIANGATIAALLLTAWTRFGLIDAFLGLGVAVWLVWKAVPVARGAVDMLMDHELPVVQREQILAVANAHPHVSGVHDMRTRQAGSDIFVELHVELDGELKLRQAHAVGEQVEQAIRQTVPGADIVLHFDPAGVVERRRDDEISGENPV